MTFAVPALVSAFSFTFFMALAAPGLTWFDGGELALAAGTMGVAHPPGEPAYLVLAKLAALLPVGDLPFRLTLLSAATVSLSAGIASALGAGLWELCDSSATTEKTLAAQVSGGLLAVSSASVLQATRPELYGLSLLLGLSALAALLFARRRGPALAVLALCVAGGVHYALLVAAVPGLALLAWQRGRGGLKYGAVSAAVLLVPGLLQYLWLPLRARTGPVLDFGAVTTWERMLWAVTAGPYRRSFGLAEGQLAFNAEAHCSLALQSLGVLALILAVVGVVAVARRVPMMAAVGVLLVAFGVLPTLLQGVFSLENPDLWGYLLLPVAVLGLAAAVGSATLVQALRRRLPRLPSSIDLLVCLAVLLGPALSSVENADHAQRFVPARLGNAVLDGSPPGGVLFLAGDSWFFPAFYQRHWEGRRSDLELLALHQLSEASLPALANRGVAVPGSLRPEQRQRLAVIPSSVRQEHFLRILSQEISDRPVLVNNTFLPPELEWSKISDGLLYRLRPLSLSSAGDASVADADDSVWRQLAAPIAAEAGYAEDRTARGVLARHFSARAGFYRSRGLAAATGLALERGARLNPDTSHMIHLARYRFREGLDPVAGQAGNPLVAVGPWTQAFAAADDRAAGGLLDAALAAGPKLETAVSLQALRGAARLLVGDITGAREDAAAVLEQRPLHPQVTLLQERLYILGQPALLQRPATGPSSTAPTDGGAGD